VFATSLTLSEEKFSELSRALSGEDRIYPVVCDGLAKLIDKEDLKGAENFIRPLLENIKSQEIKSIVLGCTHYSLIKPLFYKIYPGVKIFDGNSGTARHIHRQISPHDDGKDCKLDLFLNGGTDEDFQIAYRYLNREMEAGNE
jgi:glutamate racemase